MNESISIILGKPKHGWLPVNFYYDNFKLDIDASDVLNNPIEEIYYTIINLNEGQTGEITWWLEPFTYFFYFEKSDNNFILSISQAEDIDDKRETIKVINGDYNQIIVPLKEALIKFCSYEYEENDWPYKLDSIKLERLLAE